MPRRHLLSGAAATLLAVVSVLFAQMLHASAQGQAPRGVALDPIVIPNCKLVVIDGQNVPALRNGAIEFIGTEIKTGEVVPPHVRTWEVQYGDKKKMIREVREGDEVKVNDLLGRLDARLANADYLIRQAKVTAAVADWEASQKLTEETYARYDTQKKLWQNRATSFEEMRGAGVTWEKYVKETVAKQAAIETSKAELKQAETVLDMHEVRSKINGRIKTVNRKLGEAVKELEPVIEIINTDNLRVDGQVETQYLTRLQKGMRVVVEPSVTEGPAVTLRGHSQPITGVAVSNGKLIISGSEDNTVRVWDQATRREKLVLQHPSAVRAVACNPPATAGHLVLTGCADGTARIYDLDTSAQQPTFELKGEHRGAIHCVAFSLDGKLCATGGEYGVLCVWETATGKLKNRLPDIHRDVVTSLQFLPGDQLLSASKDRTLLLWPLTSDRPQPRKITDQRSDNVAQIGASLDGKRILVDSSLGSELRILSLPSGSIEGSLLAAGGDFKTLALISPDGRLALSAQSGAKTGMQLWRLATQETRAYELRQLVPPAQERSDATCAAFAPDGSFLATGSANREVFLWAMPPKEEVEQLLTAVVTYIEQAVESASATPQVRIWAEIDNRNGRLIPGGTVTMVAYPR